jgi:putative ABC transport system permease protein
VPQTYVWAKGPPRAAARALAAPPLSAYYVTTTTHFTGDPQVLLVKNAFRYMRLTAVAAALLVLVGLLLYLQARQRSQTISSAFAGRMGLGRGAEIASLVLELAVIALVAALVGAVVALWAASPIAPHIDPLPASPPAPAAAVPWTAIAELVAALAVVVVAAAAVTSWTARRADVSEALRA